MASQPTKSVCVACQWYTSRHFYFSGPEPLSIRDSHELWGSCGNRKFTEVQNNQACRLCQLVCKSLAQNNASQYPLSDVPIYYHRILFGVYEAKQSTERPLEKLTNQEETKAIWNLYCTNRLHVSTSHHVMSNVGHELSRVKDLEVRDPVEVSEVAADILLLAPESNAEDEADFKDVFLQGRRTGDQVDPDLITSWVNLCTATHGEVCFPVLLDENSPRPSRFIDVERRMVVPTTFAQLPVYAALSYRWASEQITLRGDTFDRLTNPGGLDDEWDDIPLTIKDAMTLCHQLSIQYLWVDALCIQQGDDSEKQSQMRIMDLIYSGAYLTIVGASGSDSRAGLPGVGGGKRFTEWKEAFDGITLASAQPTLRFALKNSSWNTRAWTFQEATLSKRLLIFTDFGIFFQCNTALWREDTEERIPQKQVEHIRNARTPRLTKPFWKGELPSEPDFKRYTGLVQDYTRRSMGYQTDALNAFGGLMRVLEKPFDTTFFQGLPLRFFDRALRFELPGFESASRRSGFPSWSWCGWQTDEGVNYEDVVEQPFVRSNYFHRIQNIAGQEKRLIRIAGEQPDGAVEGAPHTPTLSDTVLASLTDTEIDYLLIFQAITTVLFVDVEIDRCSRMYSIRQPFSNGGKEPPSWKVIGSIYLPASLRSHLGHFLQFITIGGMYEFFPRGPEKLQLFLTEKDQRGISYRVQICEVNAYAWLDADLTPAIIYML